MASAAAGAAKRGGGRFLSALWRDRAGRFSALRLATAALAAAPLLWLALALGGGRAGPEPIDTALHITGEWAVTFLLLSLAVTPMQRAFRWSKLLTIRRMLGLTTLIYALAHVTAYVFDQGLDLGRVASEIWLRVYLTIGFIAVIGLVALGVTSTDAWIRRLGPTWRRLHQLAYPIAALGLTHYLLQSKLDAGAAVTMTGLFALLMLHRIALWRRIALTPASLLGAAVLATALTMGFELAWYASATNVPPAVIWEANFNAAAGLSPAWRVGLLGALFAGAAALHQAWRRGGSARRVAAE
ncbi:MAG: protein-methionine-sulfoxide reductase heme-binding subunit MsrQ [Pseudomonadota bacterium]